MRLLDLLATPLAHPPPPTAALASLAQVLYALTLVPVGLLADRVDRPRLLAGGIALWSLLTMAASETHSFGQARETQVLGWGRGRGTSSSRDGQDGCGSMDRAASAA